MEKILTRLFDFQRFENNEQLSELIKETEDKYINTLALEDLENVTAAGDGICGNTYNPILDAP